MARPIAKRRRAGSSQRCDFWLFAPRKSEPANRRAGTSCAFRVCGVATTTTTAPARTIAACGALSIRSRSSFGLRHPCSGDRGFWSETESNPLSSLKKNPLVETVCSTFQACPFRGTEGSNPSRSSGESDELSLRAAVPDRWAPTERLRTAALLSVPHSPVEVISPFFVAPRERKQIELRIGEMAFILGDGQQLGR